MYVPQAVIWTVMLSANQIIELYSVFAEWEDNFGSLVVLVAYVQAGEARYAVIWLSYNRNLLQKTLCPAILTSTLTRPDFNTAPLQ